MNRVVPVLIGLPLYYWWGGFIRDAFDTPDGVYFAYNVLFYLLFIFFAVALPLLFKSAKNHNLAWINKFFHRGALVFSILTIIAGTSVLLAGQISPFLNTEELVINLVFDLPFLIAAYLFYRSANKIES